MQQADQKVVEFLAEPHLATLATIRKSGIPHLSYLWFVYDGQDILMSTLKERIKAQNLKRDPRATVAIVDARNAFRWVIAEGRVEVTDDTDYPFLEKLIAKGEGPERAKAYVQQNRQQGANRVVLRFRPERLWSRGL